jgi:ketosteroid isomerase-like protein
MKKISYYPLLVVSFLFFLSTSCEEKATSIQEQEISKKQNEALFHAVLEKHLKAVSDKDYTALKSTMSPKGNMELIQPSSEIVYTANGFMKFHQEWFEVPNWTVSTKVLSTDIGGKIGVATTEFLYQEPERNGKPYFNRLIVSYTLEKINNNWYFIKDHASSVEKTKN